MAQQGYPPQYNNGQQYNYGGAPQQLYPQPGYGQMPHGYMQPSGYAPQEGYMQPQPPMQLPPQGGYGQPVINQPMGGPGGSGWMNMPQGPPNCPPGLEYLTMIDQLLIHQKVEILEALTGFETKNKFTIKNSLGQKVYYAVEDSDCLTRNCCGPIRPFDMNILDNYQNPVMHLSRPLACDSCCFPCCLQSMVVSAPPGNIVGTVQQEWSIFCPSFTIRNPVGDVVLCIEGPFCTMSICGDVEFKVMSADKEHQVGRISKQWSGLMREMFTDTDYFGITFPMDLDVKMKAVMMGACFLIDAMFFEKTQNN
ncbi:scramblase 1 [Carabus blaptoides fortunei]